MFFLCIYFLPNHDARHKVLDRNHLTFLRVTENYLSPIDRQVRGYIGVAIADLHSRAAGVPVQWMLLVAGNSTDFLSWRLRVCSFLFLSRPDPVSQSAFAFAGILASERVTGNARRFDILLSGYADASLARGFLLFYTAGSPAWTSSTGRTVYSSSSRPSEKRRSSRPTYGNNRVNFNETRR